MNTTNTGLKALFHFSLMLVMICSPISVIFSQQTVSSSCTSLKRMDVHVRGIQNRNTNLPVPLLGSGTNRVTIECTCRDRVDDGIDICPPTVGLEIRTTTGTTLPITATEVPINEEDDQHDDKYPIKLYRVTYTGTVDRVTYIPPVASKRSSMRGLVVWQESVGSGTPNVPNNYEVDRFFYQTENPPTYTISVPPASPNNLRDILVRIPAHEHGNNQRPIEYRVEGSYNNNAPVILKDTTVIGNNIAPEIRLDQITLNNVPPFVNRIRVRIQSPESNGTSIIVGTIMATSTPCCIPTLTCPSNITRSTDAGRCDYTVQGGELNPTLTGGCPVTLTNSYNGNSTLAGATFPVGTTTITWTAGSATCQVTVTVQDNEDPVLTCPPSMTIIAEAGICEGFAEWETSVSDNCGATVTWSHQSGDAFPIGTTTVTGTATDAAGNTDTCTFDVTVVQCDTCVTTMTIIHIDDNDINIGTNDMESFYSNSLYRFVNPGLPTQGVLTNITLELYARVFEGSCESDIEVRVTDPMGNMTTFEQPFEKTCDGKGLYHVVLDLPDVPLTGNSVGEWYIEFRDTNDQNIGAAEYSARFARLIYDATFDECYNTERISTYNENELLSELFEIRLYPVPTSGLLNMEYTSDEDTDLSIEIIDNVGRAVGYQKEFAISGVNTFNMNVDDLAQGLYYIRIMDNIGRMQVKPFTKVNP